MGEMNGAIAGSTCTWRLRLHEWAKAINSIFCIFLQKPLASSHGVHIITDDLAGTQRKNEHANDLKTLDLKSFFRNYFEGDMPVNEVKQQESQNPVTGGTYDSFLLL